MKKLVPFVIALFAISAFAQDATVRSSAANLREGPSMKSKVVKVLKRGEKIKTSDKKGSWYRVTSGDSSGWMHAVTLVFPEGSGYKPMTTKKRATGGVPIKAKFIAELGSPTLKIMNKSRYKLELILGGILYEIPPLGEKKIDLKRGSYEYTAIAEGLRPISGVKWFDKNRAYSWSFNVGLD